ncbi:hypothetical protein EVAR_62313_1 [Eumeta japonica]|uniref:Uncharacterized protein n=1 Tax=Eumeta variegata TaxID=151549 RepID=A0A4C1ZHA6_EUMVA|nr:hypothetical protein EVAR_62313_1 [Eumeta japonica]
MPNATLSAANCTAVMTCTVKLSSFIIPPPRFILPQSLSLQIDGQLRSEDVPGPIRGGRGPITMASPLRRNRSAAASVFLSVRLLRNLERFLLTALQETWWGRVDADHLYTVAATEHKDMCHRT